MKKINLIYTTLVLLFIATGCRDFVDPVIPYKNFENGAYLRSIQDPAVNQGSFNLFDVSNSKFVQIVEAVDPENGQTVENVDVYVSHRRGINTTDEVLVKTIPASAFSMPADGKYPRAVIEVTAPEAMSTLGMTEADLEGGDSFDIRLVLKTKDGRTFTNTNASGDVAGGAFFKSPFFYRVGVVCPSALAGTYEVFIVESNKTYTLNITETATAQYQVANFNLDFQPDFYDTFETLPISGSFADGCGTITLNGNHDYSVKWRGVGTYDAETDEITFPEIRDVEYGQGPWNNSGQGYVLKRVN